jgi:hypothetical protein
LGFYAALRRELPAFLEVRPLVLPCVRRDRADEIEVTREPPLREREREPRAEVPRFDLAVDEDPLADDLELDDFEAEDLEPEDRREERLRPEPAPLCELRARAEVRLRPAGLCLLTRRRLRARSSTVSRPTSLLKLLFWPRAVSFCTTRARLLSSNFSNQSSQEISSRESAPL